jgi:hypothetical protein
MMRFALGVFLVYATLGGAALFWPGQFEGAREVVLRAVALKLVIVPVLSAWIAAELVVWLRGARVFDARVRAPLRRALLGVVAGSIGVVIAAVALPFVDWWVGDSVVMGAGAALAAALVVGVQRKARPCSCIACGYDLREAPAPGRAGFGVCPECGLAVGG